MCTDAEKQNRIKISQFIAQTVRNLWLTPRRLFCESYPGLMLCFSETIGSKNYKKKLLVQYPMRISTSRLIRSVLNTIVKLKRQDIIMHTIAS